MATIAAEHDLPFVCTPAGTRNHFALDPGIDRDDVGGVLDAFVDGYERRGDLALVNGRVFVNNVSLGLYAAIVQSKEYRDAKIGTAAKMLPDLLGTDDSPVDAGIDGEAATLEPPLRFETQPGALRVRIAPQHPGVSPAAVVGTVRRGGLQRPARLLARVDPDFAIVTP